MPNIIDSPFKSISILYRKSHIWLNNCCLQHDLTAAQAVVILIICDFKQLTQDEITKRLALDKGVSFYKRRNRADFSENDPTNDRAGARGV